MILSIPLRLKNSQFQWLQKKSKKRGKNIYKFISMIIDEAIARDKFITSVKKKGKL